MRRARRDRRQRPTRDQRIDEDGGAAAAPACGARFMVAACSCSSRLAVGVRAADVARLSRAQARKLPSIAARAITAAPDGAPRRASLPRLTVGVAPAYADGITTAYR
jgi:hypothetical protein